MQYFVGINKDREDVSESPLVSSSPVSTLPTELLIEVFAFLAATEALAPLRLGSVCRLWREIAENSPPVWQVILLDDQTRSVEASHKQAERWIRNSDPLPFNVSLNVESSELVLPLLSPFLSVRDRWQELTVTGYCEESFAFSKSFPSLESMNDLSICIYYESQSDTPTIFSQSSPFWPDRPVMSLYLQQLPRISSLAPLHFTSIIITEDSIAAHAQPSSILEFLYACPVLQHFSLTGWIHEDDHTLSSVVVSLPYLKFLILRSTCSCRIILSNIDCPKLSEIYLAHLNVEWDMPGEYNEEGDSDDEANDFSRSPGSDRATGMGLRKLISRCNPPIRVLEMDFADMRTKDFIYLFDRLHHLENFTIVASDMSDNVLNLLRPFVRRPSHVAKPSKRRFLDKVFRRTKAGSGGEDGGVSIIGNEQHMEVRLPQLRNLELYGCLRLSGDALVDVLKTRVNFTDRFAPNSTLQEVAILECEGFTYGHSQLLTRELGRRFRME